VRGFVAAAPVLLGLASGCYFSPPPLPDDPSSERPNLNLSGAVPSTFHVLNLRDMDGPVNFTIPFTSVDAGDAVVWSLWANYNMLGDDNKSKQRLQTKGSLPTRPDADIGLGGAASTERAIQFSWSLSSDLSPGCNQLTLFVTHYNNVPFATDLPRDFSKAAMVTYWVNVNAPLDQAQTLANCPLPFVGP
jgi:hypothetical protein